MGRSWIHAGVPPNPFALVSTQTSLRVGRQPLLQPPKTTILLLAESYTEEAPHRTGGDPAAPFGIKMVHKAVCATALAFVSTQTSFPLTAPLMLSCPPNIVMRLFAMSTKPAGLNLGGGGAFVVKKLQVNAEGAGGVGVGVAVEIGVGVGVGPAEATVLLPLPPQPIVQQKVRNKSAEMITLVFSAAFIVNSLVVFSYLLLTCKYF